MRIFVILIVLISVIVGILALTLPHDEIVKLIIFRDFFDISLPILAFGALVKFLFTCPHSHHHHCDKGECKICSK